MHSREKPRGKVVSELDSFAAVLGGTHLIFGSTNAQVQLLTDQRRRTRVAQVRRPEIELEGLLAARLHLVALAIGVALQSQSDRAFRIWRRDQRSDDAALARVLLHQQPARQLLPFNISA